MSYDHIGASIEKAAAQQYAGGLCTSLGTPSLRQTLLEKKERAEREVARVEEITKLLDKNPETERILQLLSQNPY